MGTAAMSETYNVYITCGNCKQIADVTANKGTPMDQDFWSKKPCPNCGVCKLDPSTVQPSRTF